MKKVIALSGKSHTGKSTTLDNLISFLSHESSLFVREKVISTDFRTAFVYKDGNIKIGIAKPGDNEREITKNINFFEKNNFDICITATRTKGASIVEILNFTKRHHADIVQIGKFKAGKEGKTKDESNNYALKIIYEIMMMCINDLKDNA